MNSEFSLNTNCMKESKFLMCPKKCEGYLVPHPTWPELTKLVSAQQKSIQIWETSIGGQIPRGKEKVNKSVNLVMTSC